MATATNTTPGKFHNLNAAQLADALGQADALAKAAQAEVDAIKAEIKARGMSEAVGDFFTLTVTEQIQGRIDTAAVKALLGDDYCRYEKPIVTNVIRVKAVATAALARAA